MDILWSLWETFRQVVSIGILMVIPALYIGSIVKWIPWMISAPAMAVVAGLVAYPGGISTGIERERSAWQIEMHNLKTAMAVKKHQAEISVRSIENKYLNSEREKSTLRQEQNGALAKAMETPHKQESKTHENCAAIPICNPYRMLAYPSILRSIQNR